MKLCIPLILALVLIPAAARANCAAPNFMGGATGNRVELHTSRDCPDEGLLRKAKTGEVVKITDCGETAEAFLDECVPPGEYEYGFPTPDECQPARCGTYYYQSVTVTEPLSSSCTRKEGSAGPQATSQNVPWVSGQALICNYRGSPFGCATVPAPAAVLLLNALVLSVAVGWRRRRRED